MLYKQVHQFQENCTRKSDMADESVIIRGKKMALVSKYPFPSSSICYGLYKAKAIIVVRLCISSFYICFYVYKLKCK